MITRKLNPRFVLAVIFFTLIGYLIGDARGAAWGATIMISFSILIGIIDAWQNRNKSEYERMMDEVRDLYRRK